VPVTTSPPDAPPVPAPPLPHDPPAPPGYVDPIETHPVLDDLEHRVEEPPASG
jgi:hypothetical protein